MPRGRPADPDKKIASLIAQLRKALVAREAAKIEATVGRQVDALVAGLQGGSGVSAAASSPKAAAPAPSTKRKGNRAPRSAAFKAAARARMKAYWAAKRNGKGATTKPAAAAMSATKAKAPAAKKPSAGRAKQIAAMKAYWAKKKAGKAKGAAPAEAAKA